MTSGSESDDSDCELLLVGRSSATDSNNNSRSSESHSTPSTLAKKNSTLTSLLATSPKNNDSSAASASGTNGHRLSSSNSSMPSSFTSSSSTSSSKSPLAALKNGVSRSDDENGDAKPSTQPSASETKPPEKRGFIPFNIFSRNKPKPENTYSKESSSKFAAGNGYSNGSVSNGGEPEESKLKSVKQTLIGIATLYAGGAAKKEPAVEEKPKVNGTNGQEVASNGDASPAERVRVNGVNGVDRNGGGGKVASNGWIVTDIDDADHSAAAEKNGSPKKLMRSEWVVTEKAGHRNMSS